MVVRHNNRDSSIFVFQASQQSQASNNERLAHSRVECPQLFRSLIKPVQCSYRYSLLNQGRLNVVFFEQALRQHNWISSNCIMFLLTCTFSNSELHLHFQQQFIKCPAWILFVDILWILLSWPLLGRFSFIVQPNFRHPFLLWLVFQDVAVLAKSQFAKNTLEIRVIYLTFVLHVVLLEDIDPFWLTQHAANYDTT